MFVRSILVKCEDGLKKHSIVVEGAASVKPRGEHEDGLKNEHSTRV